MPAPMTATSSPCRSAGTEPRPARCAIQSSNGNGKSGPKIVTGVHFVHRGAGDRAGQPELAADRDDVVPGRDHHRGGDVDLADPAVRGELADGLDGRDGGAEAG